MRLSRARNDEGSHDGVLEVAHVGREVVNDPNSDPRIACLAPVQLRPVDGECQHCIVVRDIRNSEVSAATEDVVVVVDFDFASVINL